MTYPRSSTTTVVAIIGTNPLVEGILARLLEEEGYATRHLEAHPTGPIEGCLRAWMCCSSPPD